MNFSKGQVVIHPHHGPATISKISTRTIRDDRKEYLKLQVHDPELMVGMPLDRAEEIGVRSIVDAAAVKDIFDLLVGPSEEADKVWSRRMKSNTTRLRSGDVRTIAGLIRDLTRRNEERRLSFGEMSLLREARGPLAAELSIVLGAPAEEVEGIIEAAILEGTVPTLPEVELATAS